MRSASDRGLRSRARFVAATVAGVAGGLTVPAAVAFVYHAYILLAPNPAQLRQRNMTWVIEIPAGLRLFAGAAEGLAGLGLILPWATGVLPRLTPLAAAGLVLLMAGAILVHIPRREYPNIGLNLVLLILAAVVASLRWAALAAIGS